MKIETGYTQHIKNIDQNISYLPIRHHNSPCAQMTQTHENLSQSPMTEMCYRLTLVAAAGMVVVPVLCTGRGGIAGLPVHSTGTTFRHRLRRLRF